MNFILKRLPNGKSVLSFQINFDWLIMMIGRRITPIAHISMSMNVIHNLWGRWSENQSTCYGAPFVSKLPYLGISQVFPFVAWLMYVTHTLDCHSHRPELVHLLIKRTVPVDTQCFAFSIFFLSHVMSNLYYRGKEVMQRRVTQTEQTL